MIQDVPTGCDDCTHDNKRKRAAAKDDDDHHHHRMTISKKHKREGDSDGHSVVERLVLEHLSTSVCRLDTLRESDFLQQYRDCGADAPVIETCYDYICIRQADGKGPYKRIADAIRDSGVDAAVNSGEVGLVLRRLAAEWIEAPSYHKWLIGGAVGQLTCLLLGSDYGTKRHPAVDYRISLPDGMPAVAVSVAFLKHRLPHKFSDALIEPSVKFHRCFGIDYDCLV